MSDFVYLGEDYPVVSEGTTCIVIPPSVMGILQPLSSMQHPVPSRAPILLDDSVTTIRLHPRIDFICNSAFRDLRNLTLIENTSNLERLRTIQDSTFACAIKLASVDFSGCSMLTSIQSHAFFHCLKLRNVHLPDNVTEIGVQAFKGCTSLEDIVLPTGLTMIADGTFKNCICLKRIHIPANVVAIRDCAFRGCTALQTMSFAPEGECAVEYLGSSFIKRCRNLKTFSLPPSVTEMHLDAFEYFSNRILLPWGQFEDGPGDRAGIYPVLTMAFVQLQRAGIGCGIPIHGMGKYDKHAPTDADLVILLTALMASPESTNPRDVRGYDQETVLVQAILLVVVTFPHVLFGNGRDPVLDDQVIKADESILENATKVPPPTLVSKKRKSCK
jgi:BspA type Leucine rich repeat region (6 copies)